MKHTPGPWHIDSAGIDGNTGYYRFSISPSVGTPIVSDWVSVLGRTYAELEANAKLIAAAPELLAACCKLEARLTACARAFYVSGKAKDLREAFDGWKLDIELARALIAKATE